MAKIPNEVIVDFVDVTDHHKFKVMYRAKNGGQLVYPPGDAYLNFNAIDEIAQKRLFEKLMQRISPSKRRE